MNSLKQDNLFDLIKSLSKAEKRNFKLYANRQNGNHEAKFIQLFDAMDSLLEYDEAKIMKRCPVTKLQLSNMKAHLYNQILVSLRLLNVQHNSILQIREQMDFARILYDKGLYKQSLKELDKAKTMALEYNQYTLALDAIEFQNVIESLYLNRSMADNVEFTRQAKALCNNVANCNELSAISLHLYSLYQQLGYVRSEKDLNLINQYFSVKLNQYRDSNLSFSEKFYYYQSMVWYNYILHNFRNCYRYARKWLDLFETNPNMKELMYDNYIYGFSKLLDGIFLMNNHKRMVAALNMFQFERLNADKYNRNVKLIADTIYYYNKINLYCMEGNFDQGIQIIPTIEQFITENYNNLELHKRMLFHYKIACLYFGSRQYDLCIEQLRKINETKDPRIRRDLQCFARILTLISHYELGLDHNIGYQIKSLYSFLVRMNDLHTAQNEILGFIRRMTTINENEFKSELIKLYNRLKNLESHPYERRIFFYLDIISWLESKIEGVSMEQIIKRKFRNQQKQILTEKNS